MVIVFIDNVFLPTGWGFEFGVPVEGISLRHSTLPVVFSKQYFLSYILIRAFNIAFTEGEANCALNIHFCRQNLGSSI